MAGRSAIRCSAALSADVSVLHHDDPELGRGIGPGDTHFGELLIDLSDQMEGRLPSCAPFGTHLWQDSG
jgi:hypothetical protein